MTDLQRFRSAGVIRQASGAAAAALKMRAAAWDVPLIETSDRLSLLVWDCELRLTPLPDSLRIDLSGPEHRLVGNLRALMEKHAAIGDVRGKGLFCGAELVADRATKEPADEKQVQAVVADCLAQGVIIGATNRSLPGFNNTLCFSPALISTKDDIDQIVASVDEALGRVFG